VYVDVINLADNTEEDNLIKIQLFFYYFNTSKKTLENENLKIIVYGNSTLVYEEVLKINQTGFVNINISLAIFNLKERDKLINVNVDIIFNGTIYLENRTMSLSIQIQNYQYSRTFSSFYFVNICLLSILTSLITAISLKAYKYKKAGFKIIKDITFKF